MKWQPIETAPKDRTLLLLGEAVSVGWWLDVVNEYGDHRGWYGVNEFTDSGPSRLEPIGWQPLPPTPDRSGEAGETAKHGSTEGESGLPKAVQNKSAHKVGGMMRMETDDILLALENRRAVYLQKRDRNDALANDTLTAWEKYAFAAEACEVIALELGLRLSGRKDEESSLM